MCAFLEKKIFEQGQQGPKCRASRQTNTVRGFIGKNKDTKAYRILSQERVKTRKAIQTGKQIQRCKEKIQSPKRSGRGSKPAGNKFQGSGCRLQIIGYRTQNIEAKKQRHEATMQLIQSSRGTMGLGRTWAVYVVSG